MTAINYGTVSGSSYGFTLSPSTNDERPRTPAGLMVTQAVQTKDGWRGQVIVDKQIIWESPPLTDDDLIGEAHGPGEAAVRAANSHVVEVLRRLFADAAE